jgi:hypothetical protein
MSLTDHISTDLPAELEQTLGLPDYPSFIKRLRTPAAEYYFRVHDSRNRVLGCSPAFTDPRTRDAAFEAFIDYVEIEIHNRRQRRFDFGI